MDASHFVWQGFVGFLWCFFKVWQRSPNGRKRFNVLGALNAISLQTLCVCNDSSIGSWAIVEMFWILRARFRETRIPITIVLDNASYQRCYLVLHLAKLMGIELLFLPPYSPNLNLIERFWKLVKKRTLAAKEYATFEEFCQAIQSFVERAHLDHSDELRTLLTLRFQTLPEVTQMAA